MSSTTPTNPSRLPIDSYPELIDRSHLPLFHALNGLMLAGSAILVAVLVGAPSDQQWRIYPSAGVGLLALLSEAAYLARGSALAVRVNLFGAWLVVSLGAFFGDGPRSPILMAYSVMLIFSGWLLGVHITIGMFAASALMIVAMGLAHRYHWVQPGARVTDGVVITSQLLILGISALMTIYLVRLFAERYQTAKRLCEEARALLAEVQRREGYQRALLENSPFQVWLKDDQGRFLAANQSLATSVGHPSSLELIGRRAADCLDAQRAARDEEEDRAVIASGRARSVEEVLNVAGQVRWFETYRAPVILDGNVIGLVGFSRDVTERRQSAAELDRHRHHLQGLVEERTTALSVAKEAAEAASRAKSAFLANMSHELRTPLNAMIGLTTLARKRADDPVQAEHLDKAHRASLQLLEIINDVLDLARIEADRLSIEQVGFSLGLVISDVLAVTAEPAREKGLALEVGVSAELRKLYLRGDPKRLCQVLVNLVGNATKFTASGAIGLRILRLDDDDDDSVALRFEVEDTGTGIAPEDRERIFYSFELGDSSMTRRHGGAGLGLAISKRLVEAMGGRMGVDSEPGAGSCFWFTARFAKAVEQAAQSPSATDCRTTFAGCRILVAEDDPLNQTVVREALEAAGMRVDLAADGAQAVALAGQGAYDLVLMDIQMPNMDGLEATRAIRRLPREKRLPIIATTAFAYDNDRMRCLDAGMDDYIAKPFTPEQLLSLIAHRLTGPA